MSDVSVGEHDGKADFTMLPITGLDPNDYSCIYSSYTCIHCKSSQTIEYQNTMLNIRLAFMVKSHGYCNVESFDVVLILGGFHTMMSFVSSIGALMKGSDLSECLEMEFGTNTVPKIIDGKAISRES